MEQNLTSHETSHTYKQPSNSHQPRSAAMNNTQVMSSVWADLNDVVVVVVVFVVVVGGGGGVVVVVVVL